MKFNDSLLRIVLQIHPKYGLKTPPIFHCHTMSENHAKIIRSFAVFRCVQMKMLA